MSNFSKSDLVAALATCIGERTSVATHIIDALFDIIKAEAEAGKKVSIPGFGRFAMKETLERPGRNPRTGEPITIAAKRVLTFHPSKSST